MSEKKELVAGSVAIGSENWSVYLSRRLFDADGDEVHSIASGTDLFLNRSSKRTDLARSIAGLVCYVRTKQAAGKTVPWEHGFQIGQRAFTLRLARTGMEPWCCRVNLAKSSILIESGATTQKFIVRVFLSCNRAWDLWQEKALRRAIRREKPVIDLSAAEPKPAKPKRVGKPKAPKVKPGELLPPDERDATLREGDETIRKIMGEQ